jgi:hypothetical protein
MVVDGKVVYEAHDNANMALSVKVGFFFLLLLFMNEKLSFSTTKLFIEKTLEKLKQL